MALTVNGEVIADEIVDDEFSRIKAYYESLGRVSCCERDPEFRQMAKDNVVGRVLLMQEAERRGQPVEDADVDAAFEKLIEQHGAKEHVLLEVGLSLADEEVFVEDLRANLRMENMLVDECGESDGPADDDLRRYYDENSDLFMTQEEVRASHIFRNPQPVEQSEEIYGELRVIRRRALSGEDFEELARASSDKPEEEIDLGFFKKGELMDEFEALAFSMEVGEVSPIFLTQWGYHLAKITDRKPATPRPFEEVRDEVEESYLVDARRQKVDRFVAELRGKASIEDDDPSSGESDADADADAGGHSHAGQDVDKSSKQSNP